jgi:hypothetical protein
VNIRPLGQAYRMAQADNEVICVCVYVCQIPSLQWLHPLYTGPALYTVAACIFGERSMLLVGD